MSLNDVFLKISDICERNHIDVPYIVGGVPRDIYLNRARELRDIDLTTNNYDIARLGITVAYELDSMFKVFPDGHISVFLEEKTLDFSSNFISMEIAEYLKEDLNINDEKLFEVYSRDFTVNTLHKELLGDKMLDPTGQAFSDLDGKVIRTCAPAHMTLKDDPRRIFRAINFAARLDFKIHDDILQYALNNREVFTGENRWVLKDSFLTSVVGESIEHNADLTIYYLEKMNILPIVPMVGRFKDELIRRKLVKKYLDDAINMTEYDMKKASSYTY